MNTKRMINITTVLFALLLLAITNNTAADSSDPLEQYNVVWDAPSKDHNGSMPIGNGDIGMNVWVEPDGEIVMLLSKTDAWSENGRLLKLGRVRIKLSPNPIVEGAPFKQVLRLRQGEIVIDAGEGDKAVIIKIWIDANHPVVRVEAGSAAPFTVQASLDMWRTERRQLLDKELNSAYGLQSAPFPVYVYPDAIISDRDNQIVWYHRNETSIWQNNLTHQKMDGFIQQSTDPLLNLTFGACITGTGLVSKTPTTLQSDKTYKHHVLSVYPLCAQTETADIWQKQLDKNISSYSSDNIKKDRDGHQAWWNEFWNRSWIRISGAHETEAVNRGYVLQRWISACAGRGAYPIKFNGTIFTVDGDGFDADYRRWGGPYWWQNTRLPYWPMLASGDFDMMTPLFRMYRDMLPLEEYRTRQWFKHSGAFIGETVYFWGMYNNENYGWKRDKDMPVGQLVNRYICREYTASLELLAMMLDYYDYIEDDQFLQDSLLPMCDSLLKFWDEHYANDENGKMKMYPAQALETLQDAENPATDIAGLQWVLQHLLTINKDKTGLERLAFWKGLLDKTPPLPMGEKDGKKYILGASKIIGGRGNSENPELYTVFPFRLFGVGKPDIATGRLTFDLREVQGKNGWRQDDTQAAFLGLTETAASYLVERANDKDKGSRFPAFWGPNFDWIPDQDHGGNLLMALQTMLLQADDGKIHLMPAWPKEWDVDFKLHAPYKTVLQGSIKNGKIENLKVYPPERRKDVIIVTAR